MENIKELKRINRNLFDNEGNFVSFDKQLIQLMSGVFDTRFPLVISNNTLSLKYVNQIGVEKPLLINSSTVMKLQSKHELGYEFVSEIENKLKNSVLAFDSLTQSTSKVVLLDEFEQNTGDPMIAICRFDKNIDNGFTMVNEITSIYDKEKFMNLLIRTYNANKQFYKNEKTEQYFIPFRLQLPKDMRYALSTNYINCSFNKNQVLQSINESYQYSNINAFPQEQEEEGISI